MNIVNIPVNELVPYDKNPRKNDKAVKYVQESIKQFGFKVPIVIDKNNVVICGHTRLKASKNLRLSEVPCVVADDLTETQKQLQKPLRMFIVMAGKQNPKVVPLLA